MGRITDQCPWFARYPGGDAKLSCKLRDGHEGEHINSYGHRMTGWRKGAPVRLPDGATVARMDAAVRRLPK